MSALPPQTLLDVAIVAVGSPEAYHQALHHLKPRGRLVLFSGLAPAYAEQVVNLNSLHYHEQTLVGAYGCSYRHGITALDWIGEKRIRVSDLITHRLTLSQLELGLDLVRRRTGLKILIYPTINPLRKDSPCHRKNLT